MIRSVLFLLFVAGVAAVLSACAAPGAAPQGSGGAGGVSSGGAGGQSSSASGGADASGSGGVSTGSDGAVNAGAGGAAMAADAGAGGSDAAPTVDTAGGGGTSSARCPAVPRCDAGAPDPGAARAWRHQAPSGAANHSGRDLFVNPGAPQWVIANFRYGLPLLDAALSDEEVDIYLLRGCGATWEKLGTALTSAAAAHASEEGVDDAAGRLFFSVPSEKMMAPGRHRLRLVVAGDLSAVEVFIEVLPSGAPLFVADVDGTLTTSENAQAIALFTGAPPDANQDAAQALTLLAQKGYRPFYLTARPEWLSVTTHDWLAGKGFPPGIVHTTLTSGGASGAAAGTFKTDDLKLLAAKGMIPAFGFGNTSTDADAYNSAGIEPLSNRIFYQFTDTAWKGRRVDDYGSLLAEFSTLPLVCR
ncbi:MAG TPA: phosphatidylinositol transfer protein [Polyangia bacterium]|jgi:hypothetical protein